MTTNDVVSVLYQINATLRDIAHELRVLREELKEAERIRRIVAEGTGGPG